MDDVGEPVLLAHRATGALHCGDLYLDGAPAGPADEVVVVRLGAPPVDRLPVVGAQHVDQALRAHRLQGAVDRGQPDRVAGLDAGADDYLAKPFNPRELLARIHAVLRRQGSRPPGAPEDDQETIRFGNIEVDLAARTLTRGAELQSLTTGEFAVLKVMLQHPRQPLSRDKLMTLARGREQGPFDRAIDVQVSRLRKLIEADPAQPRYLQTVWGFGYVFVPDGAARD